MIVHPSKKSISIIRYCRFGNNIFQVYNAICFAKAYNIKRIYVGNIKNLFLLNRKFKNTVILDDIEVINGSPPNYNDVIEDKFFHETTFGGVKFVNDHKYSQIIFKEISEKIMGLIKYKQKVSNELFVYLRSGDIFNRPQPKLNYIQPPLAFYAKAIVDQMAKYKFTGIRICFEDYSNIVINPLIDFCKTLNLPVTIQSNPKNVAAELKELIGVRNVVTGFSSFMTAIFCLSGEGIEYNYFKQTVCPDLLHSFDFIVNRYEDIDGLHFKKWFVVPHANKASDEQKYQLLNYPVENIRKSNEI